MKTILIVDDEPRTREGVRKTLEAWSSGKHRIEMAASGVEALQWLQREIAHLVITDIRMPEIGGLELIERLQDVKNPPVIIVISGYSEFDYARKALQHGVVDYLLKPLDKRKLVAAVESALAKGERQQQIERMERLVDPKLLEAAQQEKIYSVQVQEALEYVDGSLHEPVSLKEVAEALHLNSSYFSVLFKDQTGITFSEYLTRRRVQRAKELLAGTSLSVAEISERVGYQTAKYFVKVFRDHESVSPSQYRQGVTDTNEHI
ncbi:response regulator [Paenibacillus sp. JCM 10914]|uniref:response regulator transcription factor n=1 Tax=Paenibacillus sp. JCM 10914 TaxID=1236974 RepID=UPI0003CC3DCD|nr:response regulator [Paenibacillus sp. JCM 10914]GAE07547.1 two-component response regulator yesN [Paenibacillus sp. JCM 10914]